MEKLVLTVPTYYGAAQVNPKSFPDKEEFDEPRVPVLVRDADGVRVVLGTNNSQDVERPDVQIERRPNGWAIVLHPIGGGDACGFVYFLDDGRSFLVPEHGPEQIRVLNDIDQVPGVDAPPIDQNRFPGCPQLSAAWVQAQTALRGDSNDDEHDALLALVEVLKNIELNLHEGASIADGTPHIVVPQTENAD